MFDLYVTSYYVCLKLEMLHYCYICIIMINEMKICTIVKNVAGVQQHKHFFFVVASYIFYVNRYSYRHDMFSVLITF